MNIDKDTFDIYWKLITATAGLFVFFRGIFLFRNAQRWKKSEFLANEMKAFFDHPDIKIILQILDYAVTTIPLPAKIKSTNTEYTVSHADLQWILIPHTSQDPNIKSEIVAYMGNHYPQDALNTVRFSPEQQYVRDLFDYFFMRFTLLKIHEKNKLFSYKELAPYLEYYINILYSKENPNPLQKRILDYLTEYKSTYVLQLFADFNPT
jgi:hypothetical protein